MQPPGTVWEEGVHRLTLDVTHASTRSPKGWRKSYFGLQGSSSPLWLLCGGPLTSLLPYQHPTPKNKPQLTWMGKMVASRTRKGFTLKALLRAAA